MKNEKDRMKELVEMYSKKEEIFAESHFIQGSSEHVLTKDYIDMPKGTIVFPELMPNEKVNKGEGNKLRVVYNDKQGNPHKATVYADDLILKPLSANEGLNKEYSRLKNLASGQANSTFKEGYMNTNEWGIGGKGGKTVNSIVDQMYDNPSIAYKPIRQPLLPEEAFNLAINRALRSGAPVQDMGFYDEVNWHLMSLGFPAKNALDIKNAILKLMEKK